MYFNYKMLQSIGNSPDSFLPQPDLQCLQAFISGYDHLMATCNISDTLVPPRSFDQALNEKLGKTGTHNSFTICTLFTRNHVEGFKLWFQSLDAFLQCYEPTVGMRVLPSKITMDLYFFSTFLMELKRNHEPFLVLPTVTILRSFLDGQSNAANEAGVILNQKMADFEVRLNQRYHLSRTCRWDRILLYASGGREDVAYRLFFEMYEKFMP